MKTIKGHDEKHPSRNRLKRVIRDTLVNATDSESSRAADIQLNDGKRPEIEKYRSTPPEELRIYLRK